MKEKVEVYLSYKTTVKVDLGMIDTDNNKIMDNLEYYAKQKIAQNNFTEISKSDYNILSAYEGGKEIKFDGVNCLWKT